MQSGYRSQWAKNVGGAAQPRFLQSGDRSPLFFWGGGAAQPPSKGDYAGPRSFLAFWMGGAAFHYDPNWRPTPPPFELVTSKEGGLPSQRRERPFIDDDEVMEFLRLWVAWNDVE
jgi:hypothetical protein